jgi:hypothetical protein
MKGPFDWPGRSDRDTVRGDVDETTRACPCCDEVENQAECNCDEAICAQCRLCARHCDCGDEPPRGYEE